MNFRNPWDFDGAEASKALNTPVLDRDSEILASHAVYHESTIDEEPLKGELDKKFHPLQEEMRKYFADIISGQIVVNSYEEIQQKGVDFKKRLDFLIAEFWETSYGKKLGKTYKRHIQIANLEGGIVDYQTADENNQEINLSETISFSLMLYLDDLKDNKDNSLTFNPSVVSWVVVGVDLEMIVTDEGGNFNFSMYGSKNIVAGSGFYDRNIAPPALVSNIANDFSGSKTLSTDNQNTAADRFISIFPFEKIPITSQDLFPDGNIPGFILYSVPKPSLTGTASVTAKGDLKVKVFFPYHVTYGLNSLIKK